MKIRALIAQLPEDSYPTFICAMDYLLWEIIPEEEWEDLCREMKPKVLDGMHLDAYDYMDVTITLPGISKEMFSPREFTAEEPEEVTAHGDGDS